MKKSIAFLPKENREDLKYLVSLILEKIPVCEMIILFGSYARGTFVRYDERVEFGIPTTFRSDYDILVIDQSWAYDKMDDRLARVQKAFGKRGDHRYQVPVQFIHDSVKKVNKDLEEGRYFYTEVKRDGIVLYNSGNIRLARRRKLKFDEIKKQAEEYYKEKYEYAEEFYDGAQHFYKKGSYKMAAFMLHQACEKFFNAISLTFTQKSDKEHNLGELFKAVRGYVPELYIVFPVDNNSNEDKRLFKILIRAYIEARYNPDFEVSKEDLEALMLKVEKFGVVTREVCERRIQEFGEMKY